MKKFRFTFECYESDDVNQVSRSVLMEGEIKKPEDIFSFGLCHADQIKLIQSSQDHLLKEQCVLFNTEAHCPHCKDSKLVKYGKRKSVYHDVFTDHNVIINRHRCQECHYEPTYSIRKVLGSSLSGDLIKVQAELGSTYSYRESEQIFAAFSRENRSINNHDRIKGTLEQVGTQVSRLQEIEKEIIKIEPADELIMNVDGGHIKSIEDGKRSFEAMTAVIYRPDALVANSTDTRNYLTSKHCAASAKADENVQMINNTIIAALKQGLSPKTTITALCDGAANCWQIVDALKPLAASVTCILDWFHLAMKIQNIALPEQFKSKLIKIKWHLWRGRVDNALTRLTTLIEALPKAYHERLEKLQTYLTNNINKIVDYRKRQKQGLVFTSNLAESTVESLINQRCKGQQHMRWSREGIEPLLQLRAAIASDDWKNMWKTVILNTAIAH